jgi:SAM-dependent methyltransferase
MSALMALGDRLGLFKAMADGAAVTPGELAAKTGMGERHLREWLSAIAAADYLSYDAASGRFSLSPEQAMVFSDEASPAFFAGAFEVMQALWVDQDKVATAFQSGTGVGWHEHSQCLFRGTERFFRPGYNANLLSAWIPALDGVQAKLETGAKVADVGCGHGASSVLLAGAFPNAHVFGFDYHAPSIARAKAAAAEAGVAERTTFETASAKSFPARDYDLVAMFDCLHDMGDPVGAGRHVRETLAPDGVWMIVEPFAHDRLEDNLNPVGRIFYAASTMICTPASLSQEVGLALGAQAGEKRLRDVVREAGFTRFRRAAETPFNIVYEARL